MNTDLICSWLGLPPGEWPPDPYRLLGLEPGEVDAVAIEQRVHERLDSVRRYQMMHPEQATEAMNRLAQAFVSLMEQAAKKTNDAAVLTVAAPPAPVDAPRPADTLDWLYQQSPPASPPPAPPPLPANTVLNYKTPPPLPPLRQPPPLPSLPANDSPPPAASAEAAPPAEPVDPLLEAAQSGPARRGIATKRAIYHRIARTRLLLRHWTDLGKYLNSPKRRLNRATEGPEFVRNLDAISASLKGFPPLLGEAGQPGYLVLALTQVDTIKVFQSFSPLQREALTRDWRAGSKLLVGHRDFLRRELRTMRRRPLGERMLRAAWAAVVDQPGTLLLLLALLAVNIALWRTYAESLWEKIFAH